MLGPVPFTPPVKKWETCEGAPFPADFFQSHRPRPTFFNGAGRRCTTIGGLVDGLGWEDWPVKLRMGRSLFFQLCRPANRRLSALDLVLGRESTDTMRSQTTSEQLD
jgi:hypothetical protein